MDTTAEKNLLSFALPPLQNWTDKVFTKAGITVDILRLDLIHPIIGGNKWMKLKGFVQRALSDGKSGIITKGGLWSNHIHACAWLCKNLNFQCHLWIKGNSKITTTMLADAARWKATIRYINRDEFYDETTALKFADENNLLYVPMGGADVLGMEYVSRYLQQLPLAFYDHAVCAVGTGTTFGGLAFIPNNFSHITGIDCGTNDVGIQQKMMEWQQLLPYKKLMTINTYRFGGFARHTPLLISFMNNLYAIQQIPTDIVYTGKLLFAVKDMAGENYFPQSTTILVIHSGGLQGNRSLPAGTLQF